MTASPEVRQLAEKLCAQGICQTMASAFQMAESMLVTSVKVTRDFNTHYEKEDKKPVRPSLVGLPPTVAGMFDVSEIATEGGNAISDPAETKFLGPKKLSFSSHDQKRINSSVFDEPKDPLADPKDDPKDPDEEDDPGSEEEKVSTLFHPHPSSIGKPKIETPKPLFHAPPMSGMTLHELMDTGNGELRFDGSKVHYNEQKMPEQATLSVESAPSVQMAEMSHMHETPPVSASISAPSAHIEVPASFEAPKPEAPVEAPQTTTVELPKAPVQASRAELEKKNALYQKVDLSAVFGVKK